MPTLDTFAFIHPMQPEQLQVFRDALPHTEFIASDRGLPDGIERAQGAAIHWEAPPTDVLLAAAPNLRWLHLRGAGIDRIAHPRLAASNIVLTNGSGNHAPNIAEHVLAMMLGFARQLPALIRAQAQSRWQPPAFDAVFELSGQTLAVLGCGAIGQELGWRAAALGMRVLGVRRKPDGALPRGFDAVAGMDRLDATLAQADHVAIALPLTAETRGLLSAERFAAMRRGAYLYNVGRGPIVDQQALLAALRGGQLAGAGLDVTDPEPLPPESPLWTEPGVVITAHSAGGTPHSYARFERLLLENLRRYVDGQPLRNVVDKAAGY